MAAKYILFNISGLTLLQLALFYSVCIYLFTLCLMCGGFFKCLHGPLNLDTRILQKFFLTYLIADK